MQKWQIWNWKNQKNVKASNFNIFRRTPANRFPKYFLFELKVAKPMALNCQHFCRISAKSLKIHPTLCWHNTRVDSSWLQSRISENQDVKPPSQVKLTYRIDEFDRFWIQQEQRQSPITTSFFVLHVFQLIRLIGWFCYFTTRCFRFLKFLLECKITSSKWEKQFLVNRDVIEWLFEYLLIPVSTTVLKVGLFAVGASIKRLERRSQAEVGVIYYSWEI